MLVSGSGRKVILKFKVFSPEKGRPSYFSLWSSLTWRYPHILDLSIRDTFISFETKIGIERHSPHPISTMSTRNPIFPLDLRFKKRRRLLQPNQNPKCFGVHILWAGQPEFIPVKCYHITTKQHSNNQNSQMFPATASPSSRNIQGYYSRQL